MGMFSWDCRGCGHPMLSDGATNDINAWMNEVVVLFSDSTRYVGCYDGYGRVGMANILDHNGEPECWHQACWWKNGTPEFSKESERSDDQGWFFNKGDHDMLEPEVKKS